MSVLDKAMELGLEIANSTELTAMKNAELAMLSNQEAKSILEGFNEKQHYYMELQKQGQELTADQKEDVKQVEETMLDNPLIYEFFRAQQEFERVLEEINTIISKAISGDSAACSDECCTSCSGCGS